MNHLYIYIYIGYVEGCFKPKGLGNILVMRICGIILYLPYYGYHMKLFELYALYIESI